MVDTQNPHKLLIENLLNYGPKNLHLDRKNITEPDNGHISEVAAKLDLQQESQRLKTFHTPNWKCEALQIEDLAKAGFYFLNRPNQPDLVKCAFCSAEICNWEVGDDAFEEHRKWSPNCPFLNTPNTLNFFNQAASGQDVCGNAEMLRNSIPESQTFRLLSSLGRSYDDEKVRLESFKDWPKSRKQKAECLAAAGFYYRGFEDHVICFACGGGLKEWRDEDEPWEQHALWFPRCAFLKEQKGEEFIKDVQKKFNSVPSTTRTKDEIKSSTTSEQNPNLAADDGILRCKICDENERNVIFIPCKHILACGECAKQLLVCPVCRSKIDDRMKVFLS